MAREYARIKTSIAVDPQFASLSFEAQYLYTTVLLVHGSLSYCGTVDWRPKRLTTRASNLTLDVVMEAAAHLERERYVLFDPDTEEALVRTFIRNDELLRNPKMALSVVRAYNATASPVLRSAIVSELLKAKEEHPEYSSWTSELSKVQIGDLLTKPQLDSVGYTNRITNQITNTYQGADYQSDSVGFLPADRIQQPATIQHADKGGCADEATHLGGTPDAPFQCARHPGGNAPKSCPGCMNARLAREAAEADELKQRRDANTARLADIKACADCDPNGKREVGANFLADCTHPNIRREVS